MILMLAVLANNNTYTKSPWLVVCDFNQYTVITVNNVNSWLTDNHIHVHLAICVMQ